MHAGRSCFGETVESERRAEREAEETYEDRVRCVACGDVDVRLISFADGEAVKPCSGTLINGEECLARTVERL